MFLRNAKLGLYVPDWAVPLYTFSGFIALKVGGLLFQQYSFEWFEFPLEFAFDRMI